MVKARRARAKRRGEADGLCVLVVVCIRFLALFEWFEQVKHAHVYVLIVIRHIYVVLNCKSHMYGWTLSHSSSVMCRECRLSWATWLSLRSQCECLHQYYTVESVLVHSKTMLLPEGARGEESITVQAPERLLYSSFA